MRRCVRCRGQEFERVERKLLRSVGDQAFSTTIPAERCVTCGEGYISADDGAQFETAIAEELARRGATSGDAFKYMRRHLMLRGGDLAVLLSVAPETVSRWETGKRPVDPAAARLLGVLVLEKTAGRSETLERLRSLSKPRRQPKTVRLDLGRKRLASR